MEDKPKDSRILFSILTGRNSHILTIVIVGHLLTGYLLDKIIVAKFKNAKRILESNFSKKVELLYPEWLPLSIYKNTKLLNRIRNDISHNLGAGDYEPIIYMPRDDKKILNIPKRKNKSKFYLNYLINTILFDLVNYSYYSLGVSADLDLHQVFRLDRK